MGAVSDTYVWSNGSIAPTGTALGEWSFVDPEKLLKEKKRRRRNGKRYIESLILQRERERSEKK